MEEFEYINKTVYENLELILRKIDDRLDLKLHAIIFNENQDWIETVRIKSVLSDQQGQETEVIQEKLKSPEEVFKKLGLSLNKTDTDLKKFLIHFDTNILSNLHPIENISESNITENLSNVEINEDLPLRQKSNQWAILFSNCLELELDEVRFTIKYILSIEYADSVTRYMFLEKPQLSFLRMILDYYFIDYYKVTGDDNLLVINEDLDIETKYKENSGQFLQRMARLFFGKVQDFIINGVNLIDVSTADVELTVTERHQYYINNFLEKIDGISTRTYEGESPFGCMLILNTNILEDSSLVKYSIRFQTHQPIYLEDARRIRKLLELTNNERDLYLIADDKAIYGVGEIDWGQLGNNLLFKVEFKGLSRYDLLLVTTENNQHSDYRVVAEDESKIFKMTMNLEIVSRKLTSISFKNPGLGSGGFTPELFARTMKKQFKGAIPAITDKKLEKLRLIIQKATEQQNGTMVVITDPITAVSELKKLRKQSTPILPTEISPAFIKHLASIDGAIYFDITGDCHAIGVILDGLAQEHLGDASRGARFHSAHRYLEKLKSNKKGCVIAIISEDGMVNLIPDQANEAIIRQLVKEMSGYIRETDDLSEETLQNYYRRLREAEGETAIDHHHYFKIAETFFSKSLYLQAAEYYKRGLQVNGEFIYKYNRNLGISLLRQTWTIENNDINKLDVAEKALEEFEKILSNGGSEIFNDDYNCRALAAHEVGKLSNKTKRASCYNNALLDYSKALEMRKGKKNVQHKNRANLFISMKKWSEAIDDYIASELDESSKENIKIIKSLINQNQNTSLFLHALASYSEKKSEKQNSEALERFLQENGEKLSEEHPEVAAALEQYGINQ